MLTMQTCSSLLNKKAIFIYLFLSLTGCSEKTFRIAPPNVIIVLADDLGYADLSSYGATNYRTPNLDKLASKGARFTNFYVNQPVCTASRAALLTGSYSNRIGLNGALGPNSPIGIHENETTLGELFQRNGYRTAHYGKWHLGNFPQFHPSKHGFDDYYGIPYSNDMWPFHPENPEAWPDLPLYENDTIVGYNTDQTRFTAEFTERSINFIEESVRNNEPFFVYLAHPMPHVPLFISEEKEGTSGAGLYGDVVRDIDWSIGAIATKLESLGITENTLLIFLSDNGPWLSYGNHAGSALPLREGKHTVFEGGVRVPFIAHWPAAIPSGLEAHTPAMTIDLFPTFKEILNDHEVGLPIDGESILKLLTGADPNAVQQAYYFYFRNNELQAVRSQNWKLHFPHSYRTMDGQAPGLDGIPGRYNDGVASELALYDLSDDVAEQFNIADEYPEVVLRLSELANLKREQLGDSLTDTMGSENREPGRINEN